MLLEAVWHHAYVSLLSKFASSGVDGAIAREWLAQTQAQPQYPPLMFSAEAASSTCCRAVGLSYLSTYVYGWSSVLTF